MTRRNQHPTRVLAVVIIVAAVLVLMTHHHNHAVTTVTPAVDGLTSGLADQTAYLSAIRSASDDSFVRSATDGQLVRLGRSTCDALDNHAPGEFVSTLLAADSVSPRTIGALLEGAVTVYCPNHRLMVEAFIASIR